MDEGFEFIMSLPQIQRLSAYELARGVGVGSPDRTISPGAEFLTLVRDRFVEQVNRTTEQIDAEFVHDMAFAIADDAPDHRPHFMWEQFVDLAAYQEDLEDTWPEDMTGIGQTALCQIARRLVELLGNAYLAWIADVDNEIIDLR